MFKKFLIIFGCLIPTLSFAQSTNNINTHGYFNFHGGSLPINSKTIINVDGVDYVIGDLIKLINEGFGNISSLETAISQAANDANTAIGLANQAQTTANNAIPLSQKGVANGVADLDVDANVTANIKSPNILGDFIFAHKLSTNNYSGVLGGSAGDYSVNPNTWQIGSLNKFDPPSPVKITGGIRSEGDWGGSLLSVSNRSWIQWARNCAANEDAVGVCISMTTPTPVLKIGKDIVSSSGQGVYSSSTVTYGVSTVKISPALTDYQLSIIAPMDRIYTNYFDGNYYGDVAVTGGRTQPNFYYGYIKSSTTDAASNTTTLNIVTDAYSQVPGWRNGTSATPAANAPGSNSGDIIDSTLYYNYSNPAVFIGESSKQFAQNTVLNIDPTVKDTISREEEIFEGDLHMGSTGVDSSGNPLYHTADYLYGANGISLGVSGYNYFSKDKWMEKLAGAWLIFHGLDIESIAYGGNYITTSAGFIVDSVGDMSTLTNVGNTQRYMSLVSANSSGYFDNLMLMGRRDSLGSGWSTTSLHLMDTQTGSTTNQLTGVQPNSGSGGGDLTYNVPGYNHSIGIGTISADATTTDYSFIAAQGMIPVLPKGAQIQAGKNISFIPLAGDSSGHPYISASSSQVLQIQLSSGNPAFIKSNGFIVDGSTLSFYPTTGSSSGNPYIQAIDNKTIKLYTSSGGTSSFQSGNLTATSSLVVPLSTPTSLISTCIQGQFQFDANYMYTCIETNTWTKTEINSSSITNTSAESLSSTGSTINDSLKLVSRINTITTSTTSSGVSLPNVNVGGEITIFNRSANPINVYPDSSSNQIESLGLGVAQDLEPNASITFMKTSSNEWRIK